MLGWWRSFLFAVLGGRRNLAVARISLMWLNHINGFSLRLVPLIAYLAERVLSSNITWSIHTDLLTDVIPSLELSQFLNVDHLPLRLTSVILDKGEWTLKHGDEADLNTIGMVISSNLELGDMLTLYHRSGLLRVVDQSINTLSIVLRKLKIYYARSISVYTNLDWIKTARQQHVDRLSL